MRKCIIRARLIRYVSFPHALETRYEQSCATGCGSQSSTARGKYLRACCILLRAGGSLGFGWCSLQSASASEELINFCRGAFSSQALASVALPQQTAVISLSSSRFPTLESCCSFQYSFLLFSAFPSFDLPCLCVFDRGLLGFFTSTL